ncbi:hypothetical protein THARTR1_06992 [Trichoderma harzianum]|uniref:Glycosyltransferase family 28 N-terminal domain-containing protein n=1 Tax=Trichoderma harzianum TaxID=5544 RepID=A0A2K0U3P0_TRIHA|nr:hypothetical protein THARTR1_06992 [Trichoderma harzianum]
MAPFIRRRILLLTNVECGELDLFLATGQALLAADPGLDLHLATFLGVEEEALPRRITYHQINGISMYKALEEHAARNPENGSISEPLDGPPELLKTKNALRSWASQLMPYTGSQMVDVFTSTVDIIKNVKPDLVVVDSLMSAGLTACFHLEVKFAGLWKYPAMFSHFEYPVSWSKVLLNIHFSCYAVKAIKNDPQRKEVQSYLTAHTILRGPLDLIKNRPEGVKILVSSLPELDFPLVVPKHIIPCGPILRRCPPLKETDAKLAEWLAQGRTIYINMGSIVKVPVDQAIEIAKALKMMMVAFSRQAEKGRLQVLWKLKKRGRYSVYERTCSIAKILRSEFAHDRIRIVDWIQPEPVSILRTGNVICSVHQGGANSFNEAIVTGVPQLVLPVWGVHYEYAQRVERLGVGRVGNRATQPRWSADELYRELLHVLVGNDAVLIKQQAVAMKKICKQHGNGADYAAITILNECEM